MLSKIFGTKAGIAYMVLVFIIGGCQALGWLNDATAEIVKNVFIGGATGSLTKAAMKKK